jgi:hypothetical protein
MQQDVHRLAGHLPLAPAISPESRGGCRCQAKLTELEKQVDWQGQQLAALLQMFLDFKGEPE